MTGYIAKNILALSEARSFHSAERKRKLSSSLLSCLAATWCLLVAVAASSEARAASLDETAEHYRPYLLDGLSQALASAQALQERLAAKDLQGAKQAWISARKGWESIEVFTGGFAADFETSIDAWPNATEGFHAIEARLFGANRTDVEADANGLVKQLTLLRGKAREIQLTPQGLLNGTARLAFEVGESKSDGGESRISDTSLDDMRNNVAGIQTAYDVVFSSAIGSTDPELAAALHGEIEQLKALLDVPRLNSVDTPKLRQVSEKLAVMLQNGAPKIGLTRPTLEPTP